MGRIAARKEKSYRAPNVKLHRQTQNGKMESEGEGLTGSRVVRIALVAAAAVSVSALLYWRFGRHGEKGADLNPLLDEEDKDEIDVTRHLFTGGK